MLRDFVIGLLVTCVLLITKARTQSCPDIPNVAQACVSASYTAPRVLVDMSTFIDDVNNCTCSFSTNSKVLKIVTYNAPNYQACNSAIRLSSTSGNSVRFQCLMSGTYLDTSIHNTGEINFETYGQAYDTNYCLVMEQTGASEATVTITCNGLAENITQTGNITEIPTDTVDITTSNTVEVTTLDVQSTPLPPLPSITENVNTSSNASIIHNSMVAQDTSTEERTTQHVQSTSLPPFASITENMNMSSNVSFISNSMVTQDANSISSTSASSSSSSSFEITTDSTQTPSYELDMSNNFVTDTKKEQASFQNDLSRNFVSSKATESTSSSGSYQSTTPVLESASVAQNESIIFPTANKATQVPPIISTSTVKTNEHTSPLTQGHSTQQLPLSKYVGNTSNEVTTTMDNNTFNDNLTFANGNDSFVSSTIDSSSTVTDIVTGTVLLHGGETSEKRFQIIDPVNTDSQNITTKLISTPVDVPILAETISKTFISVENATDYGAGPGMISSNITDGNVTLFETITDNTENTNYTTGMDSTTVNYGVYFGASINDNITDSNIIGDSLITDRTTNLYETSSDNVTRNSTINNYEYAVGNSINDNSSISSLDLEANSGITITTNKYDMTTAASKSATELSRYDATTSKDFTTGIVFDTNAEITEYSYRSNYSNSTEEITTTTNDVLSSTLGDSVNTTNYLFAEKTSIYDHRMNRNTSESLVVGNQTSDNKTSLTDSTTTMDNYFNYDYNMGITDPYYRSEKSASTANPIKDNVQSSLTTQFDYRGVTFKMDATTNDYPGHAPTTYNSDISTYNPIKDYAQPDLTNQFDYTGDNTYMDFIPSDNSPGKDKIDITSHKPDSVTVSNYNTLGGTEMELLGTTGYQNVGSDRYVPITTVQPDYQRINKSPGMSANNYDTTASTHNIHTTTVPYDYWRHNSNNAMTSGFDAGYPSSETTTTSQNQTEWGSIRDIVTEQANNTLNETTIAVYDNIISNVSSGAKNDIMNIDAVIANEPYTNEYIPEKNYTTDANHTTNIHDSIKENVTDYALTEALNDMMPTTEPNVRYEVDPNYRFWNADYNETDVVIQSSTAISTGNINADSAVNQTDTLSETIMTTEPILTALNSTTAEVSSMDKQANISNINYLANIYTNEDTSISSNTFMDSDYIGNTMPSTDNPSTIGTQDPYAYDTTSLHSLKTYDVTSTGSLNNDNVYIESTHNNEIMNGTSNMYRNASSYTDDISNSTNDYQNMNVSFYNNRDITTVHMNQGLNEEQTTNTPTRNEDITILSNTFMDNAYIGNTMPPGSNPSTMVTTDSNAYDTMSVHNLNTVDATSTDSLNNDSIYTESTHSNDIQNGTDKLYENASTYTNDISISTNDSYQNMNVTAFNNPDLTTVQVMKGLNEEQTTDTPGNEDTSTSSNVLMNSAYFGNTMLSGANPSTFGTKDPYAYDTMPLHNLNTVDASSTDPLNNDSVYTESTHSNDIQHGTDKLYENASTYTNDISSSMNDSYQNMNVTSFTNPYITTVHMNQGLNDEQTTGTPIRNEDSSISSNIFMNSAYLGNTMPSEANPSTMGTKDTHAYDTMSEHNLNSFDAPSTDSLNNASVYIESTHSNDIQNGTDNIYGSASTYTDDMSISTNDSYQNMNVTAFNNPDLTTVQVMKGLNEEQTTDTPGNEDTSTSSNVLMNSAYFGNTLLSGANPSTIGTKDPYAYDTMPLHNLNTVDATTTYPLNNDSVYTESTHSNDIQNGTDKLYESTSTYTDDLSNLTNDSYQRMNATAFNDPGLTTARVKTGLNQQQTTDTPTSQRETAYAGDHSGIPASFNEYNDITINAETVHAQVTTGAIGETTPLSSNSSRDINSDSTVYKGLSAIDMSDNQTDIRSYDNNSQYNTTAENLINTDTHTWEAKYDSHAVRTETSPLTRNLELNKVTSDRSNTTDADSGLQTTGAQQTSKTVVKLDSTIDHTISQVDMLPTTVSLFDTDIIRKEATTPIAVPTAREVKFHGHMEAYFNETMTVNETVTDVHSFFDTNNTEAIPPAQTETVILEKINTTADSFESIKNKSFNLETTNASFVTLETSTETFEPTKGKALTEDTTSASLNTLKQSTETFELTKQKDHINEKTNAFVDKLEPTTKTLEPVQSNSFLLDTTIAPLDLLVQNTESFEPVQGKSLFLDTMIASTGLLVPSTEKQDNQSKPLMLETSNQLTDSLSPSTETVQSTQGKSQSLETTNASVDPLTPITDVLEQTQDKSLLLETANSSAESTAPSIETFETATQEKHVILPTTNALPDSFVLNTKTVESTPDKTLTLPTTNKTTDSIGSVQDMSEPAHGKSVISTTTATSTLSVVRHSGKQIINTTHSEPIPEIMSMERVEDASTSKASVSITTMHPTLETASSKINTTVTEPTTPKIQDISTPLTKTIIFQPPKDQFLPDIIPNDVIERKVNTVLDIRPPAIEVKPTTNKPSETTTTKELLTTRRILPDIIPNDAIKTGEAIVKDVRQPPIEIMHTTKRTFAIIPESTDDPSGDKGINDMGTTTGEMNVSFGDTLNAGLFEMNNKTYIIVVAAIAGLVVLAAILGIVIHHSRRNRSDKVDISAGVPEPISHRNLAFENGDPEKGNGVGPNEMNGSGPAQETNGNGINHANGNHSSIEA